MIKFVCPKCRAKLKAEDNMMGQEAICSRCHNHFLVAMTPSAAEAFRDARILEVRRQQQAKKNHKPEVPQAPKIQEKSPTPPIRQAPSPLRKWVAAHPLKSAGIAVAALALFASIVGAYFARRGKFPPTRRVERTLADHGYHKLAALPSIGVLRGRSLCEYHYAIDASQPNLNLVKVWTELEDPKRVKAISSYWFDSPYQRQHTDRHKRGIRAIIDEISGMDAAGNILYPTQDGYHHGIFYERGYVLELRGSFDSSEKKRAFVSMMYILRDKTWDD